jgi:hypothetical protein
MYALMDDMILEGFGFPRPSLGMRALVTGGLGLRAWLLRWLPARRMPRLRTEMIHRTYPQGYRIETLGPPGGWRDLSGE